MTTHKLRRNITGIRCASNVLPVNMLRKRGVPRDPRFCSFCDSQEIGTEFHVSMICKNEYLCKLRKDLLNNLYRISPQLEVLNELQLFRYVIKAIESNLACMLPSIWIKFIKLLRICDMYVAHLIDEH